MRCVVSGIVAEHEQNVRNHVPPHMGREIENILRVADMIMHFSYFKQRIEWWMVIQMDDETGSW